MIRSIHSTTHLPKYLEYCNDRNKRIKTYFRFYEAYDANIFNKYAFSFQSTVIVGENNANDMGTSVWEALKVQLGLVAFLVVLAGTASIEAYYTQFGLSYESLDLPADHIIYRGLTIVLAAPYVAIPYLIACGWLAYAPQIKRKLGWSDPFFVLCNYGLLIFAMVVTYILAGKAGTAAAFHDMSEDSHFPAIKLLVPKLAGSDVPCKRRDACRILHSNSNAVYVFKPIAPDLVGVAVPIIKRLEIGNYEEIDIGTR